MIEVLPRARTIRELRQAAALATLPISSVASQESRKIKTERFELFVADVFDVRFFGGQHGKQGLRNVELLAHFRDRSRARPSRSLLNQGDVATTHPRLSSQFLLVYSR